MLKEYLAALWTQWWPLMSCAAFTLLSIGIGIFRQHPRLRKRLQGWEWKLSLILAGLFFFLSGYYAWKGERQTSQDLSEKKAHQFSELVNCQADLRVANAYKLGLEGTINEQRGTIDSERQMNAKQQIDVNHCVVSLGQMNPRVNTKIIALPLPVGKFEADPGWTGRSPMYFFQMVILTNHPSVASGRLKCDADFRLLEAPQLHTWNLGSSFGMMAHGPPEATMSKEHDIAVTNSAAMWTDDNPIYVPVFSQAETLGSCTFELRIRQ